jgi:adhesin transport system outer membrane protein
LCAALGPVSWGAVQAQVQAQGPAWTLERVLAAAQATHPLIQARLSDRTAAAAERDAAGWARYPTPSAEATTRDASGSIAGLLRLDQPLWTGGRIDSGIELASRRLDAAQAGVDERRLEITQRVIAAYLEALRQQGRREHADAGLREHEALLEMIRRRVAQEVSSRADERLAEARVQQASTERSFIVQGQRSAAAQLAQLAGEAVPPQAVSWDGVEPQAAPGEGIDSLQAATEAALAHSPVLARLAQDELVAAAELQQRRAVVMPQVVLRVEQTVGGGSPQSRAMVVLQAQPGAGLSALAGVGAATARLESTRRALEAARREVREQVEVAWNDWGAARERLEMTRRGSEINAEVSESYARQFVIGRKSWVEVLNAVRESTQARYLVADSRAQVAATGLRLRALTGGMKRP